MYSIAKFGGTSLGDAIAIRNSVQIILDADDYGLVVLSATSGTTDTLKNLCDLMIEGRYKAAREEAEKVAHRHLRLAGELGLSTRGLQELEEVIASLHGALKQEEEALSLTGILCLGERLSTIVVGDLLAQAGRWVIPLKAQDWIKTQGPEGAVEPHPEAIEEALRDFPTLSPSGPLGVTQGFVGSDSEGRLTCLGRGGSDLSAALFAEGLGARGVHIWTDVPGIYSMDPRVLPAARPLPQLSFAEAAELAVFGAKVLHPKALWPAIRRGIPVHVASSFEPRQSGTWVVPRPENPIIGVKSMAYRRGQSLLTLTSLRMLHMPGFLAELFAILRAHHLSVDLISTSEISVALTLDQPCRLNEALIRELESIAEVRLEEGFDLIALVGTGLNFQTGVAYRVFQALEGINVRLTGHGASDHSLALLVHRDDGAKAIHRLHRAFVLEAVPA